MGALQIRLMGPFEVLREGQSLTARGWRSQQARAIFKVLVARHGHVVTTDQLLDLFWPDEEPGAARRRLHVRVSQLRRALAPDDPGAYVLTVRAAMVAGTSPGIRVPSMIRPSGMGGARSGTPA